MAQKPSETLFNGLPTIDVRSPAEYEKGHVFGAVSMPLFSNEERHEVGLMYKTKGQQEAIKVGLDLVGPKMSSFIDQAKEIAPQGELNIYCWRGGLRSGSLAWLLKTAGFQVNTIAGGYKAWRKEVMELLTAEYRLLTLGGFTGVGKTELLTALKKKGEQTIDLEALANHRGSAFSPSSNKQPSSEEFENQLAHQLLQMDRTKSIWIEDESKLIGHVYVNMNFHKSIKQAPLILIIRPAEERIASLCALYGESDMGDLKHAFKKIERRIGGQYLIAAYNYIDEGNLEAAAKIAVHYYDKSYLNSMGKVKRDPALTISLKGKSNEEGAEILIQWMKENETKLFG